MPRPLRAAPIVQFTLLFPVELRDQLNRYAQARNVPAAEVLRTALRRYLSDEDVPGEALTSAQFAPGGDHR